MSDTPSLDDLKNLVRKQSAALAEQEARFKKVLQTIPLGLVVFNKNQKIELCNKLAQQVFGYEPRELKGRSLEFIFPELGQLEVSSDALRATGRRSGGELFPVDLYVNRYDSDLIFAHVQDISERVRLENLRQDLLAMVSHDLRSPLTSIQFVLSVAVEGGYGELPPKAENAIHRLESISDRMVGLVNDLLDSEQFETGDFELDIRETTAGAVAERTFDNVVGNANNAKIRIETDVTNDLFYADEDRIVRVLTNLVGNAIKYSPQESTVTISGGLEGTRIVIRVADEGPGIPKHMRTAIFERYRQLDRDKKKKGGVGLGLFICKALIEKHGGSIWVESEEGKGSRFCIAVPQSP